MMNHTSIPHNFDKSDIELDVHLQAWALMHAAGRFITFGPHFLI
jgi:uncharacterized protein YciI